MSHSSDKRELKQMEMMRSDKTKFDVEILAELNKGMICTQENDYQSLSDIKQSYTKTTLIRQQSFLSSILHLPLNNRTIFELDVFLLSKLSLLKGNSINVITVHASSLMMDDFHCKLEGIISNNPEPLKQTIILLTFREAFDNGNINFDLSLQLLKMNAKGIILNDFGHGHASLALLDLFDFDGIKINRLFNELAGNLSLEQSYIHLLVQSCKKRGMLILAGKSYYSTEHSLFKSLGVDLFEGDFDSFLINP